MRARADEVLRTGEIALGTRPLRRHDGSLISVDVRIGRTVVDGRTLLCVVARDIGERQAAEQSLRESEERFRKLSEAAFEGIGITEQGLVVEVNQQLASLLGVSREDLIGKPVMEFVAPESRSKVEAHIRSGAEGLYEHMARRADGTTFPVEAQGKTLLLGERRLRVTALRDISARRSLEEQLRQAQRMESVGRLAGGVAHDFNNLLTVILSVVDLLGLSAASAQLRDDLGQIRSAAERASELTQQLLAFARRQIVEPRPLDLNELVKNLDRMLRRLIGEHIQLVTECGAGLGIVSADPGRIEQVVVNLIVNARDAMERGGVLTLETRNVTLDESYVGLHPEVAPGDYVMLSVSDTGLGIDAATLQHIFEPFFTTKAPGKGTGLGLATCYGIVKQGGGTISVYSEVGRGSCFKVYLPRVIKVEAPRPAQLKAPSPGGQETVLMVEDDAMVRRVAGRILAAHGYRVLDTGDPHEALSLFEKNEVALLVTDLVMPRMTGKELADRLLKVRPGLRVLYTSGYAENTIVHHGIVDAGVNFLSKPYLPDDLARAVRTALDGA